MSDGERVLQTNPAAQAFYDESAITLERQAELEAAYQANIAAGRPPYAGARLQSRDELNWVIAQRGWDVTHDSYAVKYVLTPQGISAVDADLREAILGRLDLSGVSLRRADLRDTNLVHANLSGADLVDINLSEADVGYADLSHANLHSATLLGAHMREAILTDATLRYGDLRGASLPLVNLSGADLVGVKFDSSTILAQAKLDRRTQLCDVIWSDVQLSQVAWENAPTLGDETGKRRPYAGERPHPEVPTLTRLRNAARTYQQLATALRAQGMDEAAGRYTYRAQVLRRKVFWREGALGRWFFSVSLATLAGYGYKLQRILITYVIALTIFAAIYYLVGLPNTPSASIPQQLANAYLVSLTAIHGRTFFEQFGIGSSLSWVAAVESVCGLVIEAIFTSMLVQRFFAR